MVKVTLEEEGYKTIEHDCKFALVYMIEPDDPDNDAGTCMLGKASIQEAIKAIGRCTMCVIDHMTDGDEDFKKMALGELFEEMLNPAKYADVIPLPTKLSRT